MARKTTALVPYFGSSRIIAPQVGALLNGCVHVTVPFAGSMAELVEIEARTLVVSDLHRWVINLASVVADPLSRPFLVNYLDNLLYHPDVLRSAQMRMLDSQWEVTSELPDWAKAADYFVCAWMGRSAQAGTDDEFTGNLPIRWDANGGDSNTRYRSAVAALEEWGKLFRRCNFHVMDAFDALAKVKDQTGHAVYCDPPWMQDGDEYRHKFAEEQHRRLAEVLGRFEHCRVVVRYGDHPLVRDLYPEPLWTWHRIDGRTAGNNVKREVLLLRR